MKLKDFCNPNHCSDYGRAPFNLDGRTIATDDYTLICMPQQEGYESGERLSAAKGARYVLQLIEKQEGFFEFTPELNGLGPLCNKCDGVGRMMVLPCPECDDKGDVVVYTEYNEYQVVCKSCNGNGGGEYPFPEGNRRCEHCHGEGVILPDFKIDGLYFSRKYIRRITGGSNLKIAINHQEKMLFFKADDISGVIMAKTEKEEIK